MQINVESTASLRKQYPFEWNSFRGAKYRCTSPNASDYKYYGGRGIRFCFDSFQEFLLTLGRKPSREWTLERKDVNADYTPDNVKWATRKEQMNNTRMNHFISAFGKTLSITEWSRQTGIKRRNLDFRLKAGWCIDCVFTKEIETCVHGYDRTKKVRIAQRNKKGNHLVTAKGKTQTLVEWSEQTGLKQTTISMRIHQRGWCESCAVTTPVNKKSNCFSCSHKKNHFLT